MSFNSIKKGDKILEAYERILKEEIEKVDESKPILSKKHFATVAKIMKDAKTADDLKKKLLDWFEGTDPNFDREKFLKAAGMKESIDEAFEMLPKGWDKESLENFAKSLTDKEKGEEGFFRACIRKIKDTDITDPEKFCGALKAKYFKS